MTKNKNTAELDTATNVGDVKTTIKRNVYGEWVVRLFVDGEHQKKADYFASDKEDATETAESIVLERKLKLEVDA